MKHGANPWEWSRLDLKPSILQLLQSPLSGTGSIP